MCAFRFFKHLNDNDKLKIDPFSYSLYNSQPDPTTWCLFQVKGLNCEAESLVSTVNTGPFDCCSVSELPGKGIPPAVLYLICSAVCKFREQWVTEEMLGNVVFGLYDDSVIVRVC